MFCQTFSLGLALWGSLSTGVGNPPHLQWHHDRHRHHHGDNNAQENRWSSSGNPPLLLSHPWILWSEPPYGTVSSGGRFIHEFPNHYHNHYHNYLQEGGKSIPTLAGIKYSSADFGELAQMLAVKSPKGKPYKIFHGEFQRREVVRNNSHCVDYLNWTNILQHRSNIHIDYDRSGSDETFTAALGFGIDSAVGSTYNFMPQVSIIYRMFLAALAALYLPHCTDLFIVLNSAPEFPPNHIKPS